MDKAFAKTITIVTAVALILLLGMVMILMGDSSDTRIEQFMSTEPSTVDDVRSIVVETAMSLYHDGVMSEPRQVHAEEACKLWKLHKTSKPSSYWGDKMDEAEDRGLNSALPVLVIVRTLVALNERYEASEHTVNLYCTGVLYRPPPPSATPTTGRSSSCPPGARSNILRALECRASFGPR